MGRRIAMAARQQPPARHRIDAAAMAVVEQRDHAVHHGKPGADQQHGGLRIEIRYGTGIPRIAVVVLRRILVGEIADREHRTIHFVAPARAHLDHKPIRLPLDGGRFVRYEMEIAAASGLPDLIAQKILDVGAIELTRHEGIDGFRRRYRRLAVVSLPQPVGEVVGLIDEGAHAAGAHIEQVMGVAG